MRDQKPVPNPYASYLPMPTKEQEMQAPTQFPAQPPPPYHQPSYGQLQSPPMGSMQARQQMPAPMQAPMMAPGQPMMVPQAPMMVPVQPMMQQGMPCMPPGQPQQPMMMVPAMPVGQQPMYYMPAMPAQQPIPYDPKQQQAGPEYVPAMPMNARGEPQVTPFTGGQNERFLGIPMYTQSEVPFPNHMTKKEKKRSGFSTFLFGES
eukprot:gnl/Trimastix_PCT/3675.p1 GENE.gnl/Trimastix_PCT/3675~~gnl/Trimastix_PCT/3675.p1  ORF type:complete len:205 (+),score=16.03 gnl/Trimastix_PCT/3675:85-699(+)